MGFAIVINKVWDYHQGLRRTRGTLANSGAITWSPLFTDWEWKDCANLRILVLVLRC